MYVPNCAVAGVCGAGVTRPPPHWLTCTRLTRQLFPLAAGALLARDESIQRREQTGRAASALLDSLKQSLGGALTYSRLVDDRSRAALLQQVRSHRTVRGHRTTDTAPPPPPPGGLSSVIQGQPITNHTNLRLLAA